MTRRKKRNTDSDKNVYEESAPALRIHVGRGKQNSIVGALVGAATANAAVPHRAYGSFYVARHLVVQQEKEANSRNEKQIVSRQVRFRFMTIGEGTFLCR